jgi:capsular polysaccharide biosynthesis protein
MIKGEGDKQSSAIWKLKMEKTTYWNVEPDEVSLPIIERRAPILTELSGAIITERELDPRIEGPKKGRKRYAKGGIYDRDLNLLPVFLEREAFEFAANKGNRLKNESTLPEDELKFARVLNGKYVYLGILRRHFGHFLLETLGRMWYLLKSDPNIKVIMHGYDKLHVLPPYIEYVFKLLDLDIRRIVVATQTLVVEHLIFPESEFEIRWKAMPSYGNLFNELFKRNERLFPGQITPRRVYLTRRQLPAATDAERKKQVTNEAALEELFSRRGFEVIAPEKLPFHQQIAVSGGASQIAGLKGSALHMSLFSQRKNARVIQIGQNQTMNQSLIDGVKNMESHHIFSQSPTTAQGSVVDVEMTLAALREM